MRLTDSVAALLNDQIKHELGAAYTYLGMAAYFDAEGLSGFSSWFRAHAEEENTHAMRLYDFLVASNAKVTLGSLSAPSVEYASPSAAVAAALRQEEQVTEQIKNLCRAAMEAGEFTAQPLLNWFLAEQVQEEDTFTTLLERVEAVSNKFELLTVDRELSARAPSSQPAQE